MDAEKDLIAYEKFTEIKRESLPVDLLKTTQSCENEGIPYAVGHNEEYGWFALTYGQGPMFVYRQK